MERIRTLLLSLNHKNALPVLARLRRQRPPIQAKVLVHNAPLRLRHTLSRQKWPTGHLDPMRPLPGQGWVHGQPSQCHPNRRRPSSSLQFRKAEMPFCLPRLATILSTSMVDWRSERDIVKDIPTAVGHILWVSPRPKRRKVVLLGSLTV